MVRSNFAYKIQLLLLDDKALPALLDHGKSLIPFLHPLGRSFIYPNCRFLPNYLHLFTMMLKFFVTLAFAAATVSAAVSDSDDPFALAGVGLVGKGKCPIASAVCAGTDYCCPTGTTCVTDGLDGDAVCCFKCELGSYPRPLASLNCTPKLQPLTSPAHF